jgi:hypothetical protein
LKGFTQDRDPSRNARAFRPLSCHRRRNRSMAKQTFNTAVAGGASFAQYR